jgi:large subunit ribosomal protein L17
MIHRRKGRKLKRTASHRKAVLSNLSASLIKNKKIKTTLAKAKELRVFFDRLVTKSKNAHSSKGSNGETSVHFRREVNKFIKDREAVKTLFDEIAPKVADRSGGYTRVLKIGRRLGDSAEMALIELVDYNIEKTEQKAKEKTSQEEVKKPRVRKKSKTAGAKTLRGKKKKETVAAE